MPGMSILQRGSTLTELWTSFWHICRAIGEVKREAGGGSEDEVGDGGTNILVEVTNMGLGGITSRW